MKKYLEYKDEKSHKFLQIKVEDSAITVIFGYEIEKKMERI